MCFINLKFQFFFYINKFKQKTIEIKLIKIEIIIINCYN